MTAREFLISAIIVAVAWGHGFCLARIFLTNTATASVPRSPAPDADSAQPGQSIDRAVAVGDIDIHHGIDNQ